MSPSVTKAWMRNGLAWVASLAAAVGCGTDRVIGPPPDYTLALSPTTLTIVQGATGTSAVTITRTNFTGAVTVSLGGAPAGVTGAFTPTVPTGTSSTLTVSVGAAVAPGVYNLTVAGTGTAGDRSTPFTLHVNSPTLVASLSTSRVSGFAPLAVSMIVSVGSTTPDPVHYVIDFGDGASVDTTSHQSSYTTTHLYQSGTFTVLARVERAGLTRDDRGDDNGGNRSAHQSTRNGRSP